MTDDIPPLPLEVLADFLAYLLECASIYIRETHANGADRRSKIKRRFGKELRGVKWMFCVFA